MTPVPKEDNKKDTKKFGTKKILIVAYYFPPLGGGGVPRPLKFCKYLPEFGWQPIVLTPKNGVGPVYDQTLLDELNSYKNVKVYRTLSFELGAIKKLVKLRISSLINYIKKFLGLKAQTISQSDDTKNRQSVNSSIRQSENSSIRQFINYIYNLLFEFQKFICIPDDKILWALPSIFSALRIIKKEKPDLIFATIPPYSNFVLAVLLKKLTGLNLIVDYRDPWNIPDTKKNILNFQLEKWCLKNSDKLTYVVPIIKDWLAEQFAINHIDFKLIYNGYDEDDYKDIEPIKFDKWTMIAGGDLYEADNIYFFKLLEDFLFEYPEIKKDFQLVICSNYQKWFDDYLKGTPIKENIINLGVLPKKEYLRYVKGADCACIFAYADYQNDYQIQLHGRVFDYLVLNKNLFVVGSENSTLFRFLTENSIEFEFVEKSNFRKFKEKLFTIYKRNYILNTKKIDKENFSRRNLSLAIINFLGK